MSYCSAIMRFVDATNDPAHTNIIRATAVEYTVGNNPQGCLTIAN